MKYRKFSDLGWNVSEVGLGCWQIGWCWGDLVSEREVRELLKKAVDKGVNFFDTSDTYGDGRSEKFLAELIKSTSERIFVTTKVGRRVRGTNYTKGYKEKHIEEFVDRSLIKLGIDCIDLLQLHCPPSEICAKKETYEMMDEIVKKGKIAHYGVSVWKISDAMEAIKFPNVKSIQIVFNIFRQKPAKAFLKEAKKRNVAIIARGPLASGLLTGEINQETKFPENDHRNYNINGNAFDVGDTFSGVNFEKGLRAVEKLKDLLPDNFSLTDLALKWILMHDEVTVVIPGAKNKSHVQMNTRASDLEDISSLLPKINSIYDKLIKPDVHNRW
jgi:aryl-alcohol dehydrogenase-like predicted oxidoreductase|tara:strand:+ start:347 stop:1333 length:987 start_codon:yes stop_codon:yes gene_type:complete